MCPEKFFEVLINYSLWAWSLHYQTVYSNNTKVLRSSVLNLKLVRQTSKNSFANRGYDLVTNRFPNHTAHCNTQKVLGVPKVYQLLPREPHLHQLHTQHVLFNALHPVPILAEKSTSTIFKLDSQSCVHAVPHTPTATPNENGSYKLLC